ncbi:MAG: hypothetical protein NW241_18830 [Bacteroidia bacterium]|nr:hypothetical protein [Bacteroidia bacterium]
MRFLLLLLLLSACTPRLASLRNVHRYRLPAGSSARELLVIPAYLDNRAACVSPERELRISHFSLGSLSEHVEEPVMSPGGQWLALISVGEGHPVLDVYETEAVVEAILSGAAELAPAQSLNPYPGLISGLRWLDAHTLRFGSDADFSRLDPESGGVPYPDLEAEAPVRSWRYDVRSGRAE